MTEEELWATCESAKAQIAAMPEWKQRWLEKYMGHTPPPPPARRPVAQSGTQTSLNVLAAARAVASSRINAETIQALRDRIAKARREPLPSEKKILDGGMGQNRKRKITLE